MIINEERLKVAKELKLAMKKRNKRKQNFKKEIIKEAIAQLIEIKKKEVKVGKKYKELYEQKQKLKFNILKRL